MNAEQGPFFTRRPHPKPVQAEARAALMEDPGFGRVFTDHMATIRWTAEKGWSEAEIRAREPFSLDPAAAVLHYAQEIFEGLKAYRLSDGGVALFRPERNAQRFQASAERLAMPVLPEAAFLRSIEELIKADVDWVPRGDGSLYLRPFMFAAEPFLGVRPASEYWYVVIASPVGSYFKGGKKAVTVWLSDEYTRAAPGGTGAAKCGGNYAASLLPQAEAIKNGCDQVVFLDAAERKWVEELGGMNMFLVYADGTLKTPPLSGTILPGVTRDALIALAKAEGRKVVEERFSYEEWKADSKSGRIVESFACGTAAVITPIAEIKSSTGGFVIGNGAGGEVAEGLRAKLIGIQRGDAPDEHGWVRRVV
jgi:branched-chain amino acid aminotransferase